MTEFKGKKNKTTGNTETWPNQLTDYNKIKEFIAAQREQGAFVFMPSPILDQKDSFYKPICEVIRLAENEIYKSQGNYRISFNGLLRLSMAAAFEWSAIDTCRTDDRRDKLYCSFRAVGGVRKADGRIYFHKAEKDIDLEVIEMELTDQYTNTWQKVKDCTGKVAWKKDGHKTEETFVAAKVRRDMIQKRKNKLMLVESGAKARVVRGVLGLQSQYSDKANLLGINFVMIHYAINHNNKEIAQAMLSHLPGQIDMVYGGVKDTGQVPMISHEQDSDSEIIDIPQEDEQSESKDGFNLFDINDLSSFSSLPVEDQEKWLRKAIKDLSYVWEECTEGLKGKPFNTSDQDWRNGFFEYIQGEEKK